MEPGILFEGHRFEPSTGRLWSGADEVRLTPKASAVLRLLLTQAGQPVSKEELFASVWPGTAVSGDALQSCIQELRRALSDDSKHPRFIETRHRRGYRFVAVLSAETDAAVPAPDPTAIAVLPFVDLSPGRDLDYLCDGLAEELISVLSRLAGLRVAARTASFQFREPGADLRAVGRKLGVGSLLEGSVRRAGDRLRVAVQLVDAATGYHRWSSRFDRTLDDVFAFQDEIASSVAASLRGSVLSGTEKEALLRPPTGAAAYEHYLRGRQHLPRMTRPELQKSAQMFEEALAKDAAYAPALAGLATVYSTLYEWFGARGDDLARAEDASARALTLAPRLAEARVARGCTLSLSRRYDEAILEFEEALRLDPNSFDAHYYYARTRFVRGEFDLAAELFRRAAADRREDYQSPLFLAKLLGMQGRAVEAKEAAREGLRRAQHVLELNPADGRALSLGSLALYEEGDEAEAMVWSRRSVELNPDDTCTLVNHACLRARRGEKEEALRLLDGLFARGLGKRDWVLRDPDFDTLRGDPRFPPMVERLK